MQLFITHSSICILKKLNTKNFMSKFFLSKIQNENCQDYSFGSNKLIYFLGKNPDLVQEEFVGIADAKWNRKFKSCAKIQHLNMIKYNKNTVYTPCKKNEWYKKSIEEMPKTKDFIDEVLEKNKFKNKDSFTVYENNFICEKSLFNNFTSWFYQTFNSIFFKYKNLFNENNKISKNFFCERLTAIYFANQDIEIQNISNVDCFPKLF